VGRVVLSTQITVDGVMTVDDWFVSEGQHDDACRALFARSAAMLLGRKTYEGLAEYWPSQTGSWADVVNPMPKLVASRTLDEPLEWNASLLDGDAVDDVAELRDRVGDLALVGCGELAGRLVDAGVVDELWFWVHPTVWGEGDRPFFGELRRTFELLGSEHYDSGVTLQRYRPA